MYIKYYFIKINLFFVITIYECILSAQINSDDRLRYIIYHSKRLGIEIMCSKFTENFAHVVVGLTKMCSESIKKCTRCGMWPGLTRHLLLDFFFPFLRVASTELAEGSTRSQYRREFAKGVQDEDADDDDCSSGQ